MHSPNNDAQLGTDVDNNVQIRQTNIPPTISNSSQPSPPSCSTLLVIDDTSNSDEDTINIDNKNNNHTESIPIKQTSASTAQMLHVASTPSTHDILNDTINQQRRRNSSIAKLLGGRPLRNQQYEEIHQQILDSQSAQNVHNTNHDNGTDSGIPRARSSITRTLLMNAERTNSMTKVPPQPPTVTSFAKDFEYLIRRELDKVDGEHGSTTLQRNNSVPKVVQNLNSSGNRNAQTPIMQSKLKRKRPISKSPLTISNIPPFALHDPFEIESSSTTSLPSQNKYPHIDASKRPRFPNTQQYPASMTNSSSSSSSSNQSLYVHRNKLINPSIFNQFSIHQEHTPSNPSSYKLTLPTPMVHLPSSNPTSNIPITSSRKTKSMLVRPDNHERPRQRSYSDLSDSLSEMSPKTMGPLKKRLLDAYNNEHQHPTSPL